MLNMLTSRKKLLASIALVGAVLALDASRADAKLSPSSGRSLESRGFAATSSRHLINHRHDSRVGNLYAGARQLSGKRARSSARRLASDDTALPRARRDAASVTSETVKRQPESQAETTTTTSKSAVAPEIANTFVVGQRSAQGCVCPHLADAIQQLEPSTQNTLDVLKRDLVQQSQENAQDGNDGLVGVSEADRLAASAAADTKRSQAAAAEPLTQLMQPFNQMIDALKPKEQAPEIQTPDSAKVETQVVAPTQEIVARTSSPEETVIEAVAPAVARATHDKKADILEAGKEAVEIAAEGLVDKAAQAIETKVEPIEEKIEAVKEEKEELLVSEPLKPVAIYPSVATPVSPIALAPVVSAPGPVYSDDYKHDTVPYDVLQAQHRIELERLARLPEFELELDNAIRNHAKIEEIAVADAALPAKSDIAKEVLLEKAVEIEPEIVENYADPVVQPAAVAVAPKVEELVEEAAIVKPSVGQVVEEVKEEVLEKPLEVAKEAVEEKVAEAEAIAAPKVEADVQKIVKQEVLVEEPLAANKALIKETVAEAALAKPPASESIVEQGLEKIAEVKAGIDKVLGAKEKIVPEKIIEKVTIIEKERPGAYPLAVPKPLYPPRPFNTGLQLECREGVDLLRDQISFVLGELDAISRRLRFNKLIPLRRKILRRIKKITRAAKDAQAAISVGDLRGLSIAGKLAGLELNRLANKPGIILLAPGIREVRDKYRSKYNAFKRFCKSY